MSGIDPLRNKMDEITLEMVRLLKQRTDIAQEIGRIKKGTGMPVTDESREENLRQMVRKLCSEIGLDQSIASKHLNFMLNESVRVQSEGRQTHLSIFHRAKELERNGKSIIHMEVGEPDFGPPKGIAEALAQAQGSGYTRYGPARGRPELLDAISAHVTKEYHPTQQDKIIVTPGARFAVYSAITSLLDPGDEIITIEPAWPAYRDCAIHAGIKVRTIHTEMKNGWEPDPADIEKVISPSTRMIVLNYPNNPTGKTLPKKLTDEIVSIAQKNSLYILSDEIYAQYSDNPSSILEYEYDNAIVTQSLSKSHAMTGFRIGYAISGKQAIQKMAALSSLCLTSVADPIQYAAITALESDVSGFYHTMRGRLDALCSKAAESGLEFARPDGAMYLFARTPADGAEISEECLKRGLAIAPGAGFGQYPDYIRISACQNEKTLIDGMNILAEVAKTS